MTDSQEKTRIHLSKKFEPLFQLFNDDFHPEIDTVIITGGRYSLKSYTVSIFALTALVNYGWNVLYTRFTNLSIVDSVKPEVSDKIDLLGLGGKVNDTNTHIEHKDNRISFKGIKTGSKGQTANLKSLSGFNLFINDEAEELPDYKTFKTVFYSIRSTQKRNLTILILNPTTKEHWIFKEFFEKKGLTGGENMIKDNVMYIHSSYLDADQNKTPKNILADYNRIKLDDPKQYENIVLGGWITELEGQIFPEKRLKRYKEFPEGMEYFTVGVVDCADDGKDHFSLPMARVYGNHVYVFDAVFENSMNLDVYYPVTISEARKNKLSELVIETNSFGKWFYRKALSELVEMTVFGKPSLGNKMGRILANAGLIRLFFYFPENPSPALRRFMDQMCALLKTSKDNDDAADSLANMAAYLEKYHGLFKE
jgi:PBSX family phage terminase large subunit